MPPCLCPARPLVVRGKLLVGLSSLSRLFSEEPSRVQVNRHVRFAFIICSPLKTMVSGDTTRAGQIAKMQHFLRLNPVIWGAQNPRQHRGSPNNDVFRVVVSYRSGSTRSGGGEINLDQLHGREMNQSRRREKLGGLA